MEPAANEMRGDELRAIRMRLKMNQTTFGDLLGCSRKKIGIIEGEVYVPKEIALAARYLADRYPTQATQNAA